MTVPAAVGGRLSRERLRTLVLDTGVELLLDEGLGTSRAPIGYADAFRWLERNRALTVSRAQVHRRIWDSIDHYRVDVLTELTSFPPAPTYTATLAAVTDGLGAMAAAGRSPLDAPAPQRRRSLMHLAKVAVEANAAAARTDRRTAAFDALWAMHSYRFGSGGELDDPIRAGVFAGQQDSVDRFIAIYEEMGRIFGAEAATHWGVPHEDGLRMYAELTYCLNHGAASRAAHHLEHTALPLGGDRWTVEGLTAAAVTGCVASVNDPPTRSAGGSCVVVPRVVTKSNNDSAGVGIKPDDSRPAGHRMGRSELRRHMLESGMAILVDRGFGHGAEHVTYSRVFERVARRTGLTVSRAQVHGRIWRDQLDFQLDVLARAAGRAAPEIGAPFIDTTPRRPAPESRTSPGAMAEVIRSLAATAITAMTKDRAWLVAQAIASFHAVNPRRSERIGDVLHHAYQQDIDAWRRLYQRLAELYGLVPQPWTGVSTDVACTVLAHSSDALAEGVAGRMRMGGSPPEFTLRVAGNEPARWELFGIGLWSLVNFLLEPSPDDRRRASGQNST